MIRKRGVLLQTGHYPRDVSCISDALFCLFFIGLVARFVCLLSSCSFHLLFGALAGNVLVALLWEDVALEAPVRNSLTGDASPSHNPVPYDFLHENCTNPAPHDFFPENCTGFASTGCSDLQGVGFLLCC